MTTVPSAPHLAAPARFRVPSTAWAWLAYAVLTLGLLGSPVISRVQEARVLETSRQMLSSTTWDGWLRPQLNGEPRLRKPPLCYWYTAASYRLFGRVDEASGRLPVVLVGWATLAVVWAIGRDLGGRRMAFFAAATLASSSMFLRFIRSAETDPPASLGVALACWGILRGSRAGGRIAWFWLAAVGIALAAMTKGGPATFPLAFVAFLAIATRSWRPVRRFVLSGAPLVALALIAPWYVYAIRSAGGEQVGQEVAVVMGGANHFGLFYEYFLPLLQCLLPWTGWFVVAILAAIATRQRLETPARVAIAIIAAIFVPLALALNVQQHYLLPILPGCALLVAWLICRLSGDDGEPLDPRLIEASRWVLGVTTVALVAVAPAAIVAGALSPRGLRPIDFVAAAAAATAAGWLIVRHRHSPPARQYVAFATAMLITMPILASHWGPSLRGEGLRGIAPRAQAALTAALGREPGPYLDYADAGNITLAFYLRREMTLTRDDAEVRRFVAEHPNGVVVVERSRSKNRKSPPDPFMPEILRSVLREPYNDDVFDFLVAR